MLAALIMLLFQATTLTLPHDSAAVMCFAPDCTPSYYISIRYLNVPWEKSNTRQYYVVLMCNNRSIVSNTIDGDESLRETLNKAAESCVP